jgi:hypothetical protein
MKCYLGVVLSKMGGSGDPADAGADENYIRYFHVLDAFTLK